VPQPRPHTVRCGAEVLPPPLRARRIQLENRRTEPADLLDQTPTEPSATELDQLAHHIDQIINRGTPTQRKALVEQPIAEIQILGPGQLRPIYRIPHHKESQSTPAPCPPPHGHTWLY
jgi:hypothetical protein